jgi:hypothetical protein
MQYDLYPNISYDIDWNETLSDKDTTDMIDIFMSKLTLTMKHNIPTKRIGNKFAVSAICFSRFFRSLVIIDFALFRALAYSL